MVEHVEYFFRDEERAGGTVRVEQGQDIPWTAIRNVSGGWYVVLHGTLEQGTASLMKLIQSTIEGELHLAKAA